MPEDNSQQQWLPWVSAGIAALIALWMTIQSGGVLNNDGMLYIEAARFFADQAWQQGLALYNWPFYSLLIAALHAISGLSLQASAHALTVLLFGLTSAGFVLLIKELGGNRGVMIAAASLLFCSPYIVRSLLPMIIRDHGFLSFHIWSLVFFLRFYQNSRVGNAIGWGAAALLATLFRIEGIIYLVLLPAVLLIDSLRPWSSRWVRILKCQVLPIGTAATLTLLLFWSDSLNIAQIGRLGDPITMIRSTVGQLTQGLSIKAEAFGSGILGPFLENFALAGLLATLMLALIVKTATSAGVLQLLLAALPSRFAGYQAPRHIQVLGWLALIGIGNAVVILINVFVLSTRYLLPLAILIQIFGAFGLYHFMKFEKKNWMVYAVLLGILLQFAANIWPFSAGHRYEVDATHWIQANIPEGKAVFFDEGRMRYYVYGDSSNRKEIPWERIREQLTPELLARYDYVVLHVSPRNKGQQAFLNEKLGAPLAAFGEVKRKQVQVFALSHTQQDLRIKDIN